VKKLYYGGAVLTMNSEGERAEKVLTENGRILAVGSFSDEGIDGERIDLKGKTLMPGFVDGHSHMIGYGLSCTSSCDLTGASSFDEILERILEYKRKKGFEDDEPISCRGYDPALLKEGRHPDAAVLDRAGLKNPISCVHISGHMAAYNTAAMEKAGVFSMDYVCPEGGFAGRKEDGTSAVILKKPQREYSLPFLNPRIRKKP
jgi:predicted amidohydrolase YtcJ